MIFLHDYMMFTSTFVRHSIVILIISFNVEKYTSHVRGEMYPHVIDTSIFVLEYFLIKKMRVPPFHVCVRIFFFSCNMRNVNLFNVIIITKCSPHYITYEQPNIVIDLLY